MNSNMFWSIVSTLVVLGAVGGMFIMLFHNAFEPVQDCLQYASTAAQCKTK